MVLRRARPSGKANKKPDPKARPVLRGNVWEDEQLPPSDYRYVVAFPTKRISRRTSTARPRQTSTHPARAVDFGMRATLKGLYVDVAAAQTMH